MITTDADLAKWFSDDIYDVYQKAKIYQGHLPEYCLIKVRDGVDLIVDYLNDDGKDSEPKNLFDKIQKLKQANLVNQHIFESLHCLRKLGNLGAHISALEFNFNSKVNGKIGVNIKTSALEAVDLFRILLEDLYISLGGRAQNIRDLQVLNQDLSLEPLLQRVFIAGERDMQTLTDLVLLLKSKALNEHAVDVFLVNQTIEIAKYICNDDPNMYFIIGDLLLDDCFHDEKLEDGLKYLRVAISHGNLDACVLFANICGPRKINILEVKEYVDMAYKADKLVTCWQIWKLYNGSLKEIPANIELCIEALEKGAREWGEFSASFYATLAIAYTDKAYNKINFKKGYECISKIKPLNRKMAVEVEKMVKCNFSKLMHENLTEKSSTLPVNRKFRKTQLAVTFGS